MTDYQHSRRPDDARAYIDDVLSHEPDPDTMQPAREPFAQLTPTPRPVRRGPEDEAVGMVAGPGFILPRGHDGPTDAERFETFGPVVDPDAVPELVRSGVAVWSFGYGDDPVAFATLDTADLWAFHSDRDGGTALTADHDPETCEPCAVVRSWSPFRAETGDRIMRPRPGYAHDDSDAPTLPDGADPDGPRTCEACGVSTAAAPGVLCLSCIESGAPLDPEDEAAVAELAAYLAPAPLTGPGFTPPDAWSHGNESESWARLLAFSAQHRRALVARMTSDPATARGLLRELAAEYGIVPAAGWPDRPQGFDVDAQKVRELVEVGSSLASGAERDRAHRSGRVDASWRAWRGDLLADYDASAERFELSPSGRWARALPPLYAAGYGSAGTRR